MLTRNEHNSTDKRRKNARQRAARSYELKKSGKRCVKLVADTDAAQRMFDDTGWTGDDIGAVISAWFDKVVTPWKRRK